MMRFTFTFFTCCFIWFTCWFTWFVYTGSLGFIEQCGSNIKQYRISGELHLGLLDFVVVTIRRGNEFPHRLCYPLPPVILFYHVSLQPTSGNIKQQSQGVGGHRVYVGIRHPIRRHLSLNGHYMSVVS